MIESIEKHARIQSLTNVMNTMIESCPTTIPHQNISSSMRHHHPPLGVNNIVKVMLKKGLINDLARVTHSLDLSSPNMATTVNCVMKPLETLSRIVNQPTGPTHNVTHSKKSKTTGESLSSRREEGATETENGTQQQTETGNNNNDATNQSLQNVINSLVENLTVPVNGTTINSGSDEDNSGQRDQSVPLIDLSPIRENVAEGMVEPVDPISDDAIADDLAMVDAALVMAVEEMEDDVDEERSSERRRLADESHDVVVDEDMASERNVGDRHHHHGHDHESSSSSSDGDDSDDDSEGDDDGAEEEEEENSDAEDHADDDDEDEDDHDNEDDEDDDDDDDDDDEEEVEDDESNVTFDEGLEGPIESALIRVPSDRHGHHHVGLGIEEDILLDIDELISPAALRGGIAGLIPMLDDAIRHDLRHEILGGHSSGESSQPIVPPAPGNVTIHHPLLVRHSFQDSLLHSSHAIASAVGGAAASILAGGSRHHRTAGRSRELGSAHRTIQRYMSSHDRSMFGGGHHPWSGAVSAAIRATGGIGGGHQNPPVILQRLLANSSAQDFLQMSSHHHGIGGPSSGNRFILSGNDFQIIATDDFGDYVDFHDPFIPFGGPSSAGASSGSASSAMSSIPNAMSRWTEESRVLDGDSMHDCVSSIKSEIVEFLEKCRDDEINDRKTKRQKMIEEEEKRNREKMEKKSQEKQENKENREQSKTEQVTASEVTSGSGNTEQGATASSENSINSSTEQLAANIVEQVLAPFSVANVDQVVTGSLRSTPIVRTPPLLDVTSPLSPTPVSVSTEQVAERQLVSGQVVEIDEIPPTSSQEQSNSCNNNVVEMMDVNGGSSSEGISSVVIPERPTEENATRVAQSEEQPSTIANESQSSTDNAIEQSNASSNETQPQTNFETTGEATTTTTTGESGSASTTNDPEIPEGVDPSFLAALPENIRQEVIADQLRIQRQNRLAQQARQQQSVTGTTAVAAGSTTEAGAVTGGASSSSTSAGINNLTTPAEISPEFLAALPPNIREEVIAEHTAQERLAQAQQNDPNAAVDPASFIQSLPPGLRRQVLADMDDSQIALLPPDLASEAQALRSELEQRQRQIQERFFSTHGSTLSRILRSAAARGGGTSGGGSRYAIHTIGGSSWPWNIDHRDHHGGSSSNRRMRLGYDGPTGGTAIRSGGIPGSNPLGLPAKFKGKQLLDHEALSCLLILLFVDEPKLNVGRLHRVLRNLSQHPTTRAWIIQSLLAIMDRTRDCRGVTSSSHHEPIPTPQPSLTGKHKKSSVKFSTTPSTTTTSPNQSSSWLSISLDAALGCKMNVFQVQHTVHPVPKGKKSPSSSVVTTPPGQSVTIHPQAAPLVSRHVLDALISLAKSFPSSFVTTISEVMSASVESTEGEKKSEVTTKSPLSSDFWDVLVRLDSSSTSSSGKGKSSKSIVKSSSQVPTNDLDGSVSESGLTLSKSEGTPLKSIIELLSHPVIRRSAQLTDRLLRLLSLIALALHQQQSGQILATSRQISTTSTHTNDSSSTTTTTVTAPATKSDAKVNEPPPENKSETRPFVGEDQLRLAVEVLTTKSCSEEGLEDVNSLLLRLSQSCPKTRDIVLKLLLAGARQLGRTVKQNIDSLFEELRSLNQSSRPPTSADEGTSGSSDKLEKGIVHDRFTKEKVVITAPTMRPGHTGSSTTTVTASTSKEVQLPSMAALTSRTSSQQFFLRILKVIIQLRESIRLQKKKELEQRARLQQISISGQPSSSDVAQPVTSSSSSNAMEIDGPSASTSNTMTTDNQQRETNNSTESNVEKNVDEQSSSNPSSSETTKESEQTKVEEEEESLSSQLSLDDLWNSLSRCLLELADAPDHHAVLVLQPAVESFFLVHATTDKDSLDGHGHRYGSGHGGRSRLREVESRENQLAHINQDIIAPPSPHGPDAQSGTDGGTGPSSLAVSNLPPDTQKFLKFAETHKVVLNQCIRQSTVPLADGPFAVLIDHTRVLDFDVKRRYFRQELERLDDGVRREDLAVHVRREHVFEDSFRELYRRSPDEWKNRFYIVFEGEEGQDAGGLLREWYTIISREIFNPMYALFTTSPGDRVTYMINSASHCNSNHLQYFKFVGRVIAKAIYDNKLLECYFTRSFYKHILGKSVRYQDMESEDYAFYQGLVYLLENDMATSGLDLTFSIEIQEFGVTEIRDLLPNGRNIPVTEDRKHEYVRLVCQEKMTGAIRKQLNAFLEGFYEIIPKRLISIFNEQETELLLSGLPNIDIDDLKSNTEYHKYQPNSLQIQWFWRALRSFDQADRAKFLQFVTGTSKVPLQGFASLEGMNGVQKFQIHRDDRSTDRLPSAHTCFNQLDLPAYETYDKLKSMLLKAVRECSEGFGFA